MNIAFALLTMTVAAIVVNSLIPIIIINAKSKNLLDKPDARKEHKVPVPTLGGIAIVLAFLFAMALNSALFSWNEIIAIAVGTITLFVTGIIDDLHEVMALKKLLIQIFVGVVVCYFGLGLHSFYGLFGIYELNDVAYYTFNVILITGVVNAFNLIDGIDGLAGGLGAINSVLFCILFYINGNEPFALISAITAITFIMFLKYNFNPAKIFMGDTGSLHLGFLMSIYALQLINTCGSSIADKQYFVIIAASVLVLPVADSLRVFFNRGIKGRKPFYPDRTHCHHILLKNGYNHREAALLLYLSNITLIAFGIFFLSIDYELAVFLILISPYILLELLTIKRIRSQKITEAFYTQKLNTLISQNNLLKKELNYL